MKDNLLKQAYALRSKREKSRDEIDRESCRTFKKSEEVFASAERYRTRMEAEKEKIIFYAVR